MRRKQIGLYIHIPFCKQKCSYCDFCSYAEKQDLISKYIKCLLQEIKEVGSNNRADFENGKDDLFSVKTIYIGGGTPSLIESKYIVQTIEEIKSNFELDENAEITIEVNPGTVTLEKLEDYNKVGINRLSIGLQSTHEHLLKEIGRIHTYLDFLDTFRFAREAGFENINVDLKWFYGIFILFLLVGSSNAVNLTDGLDGLAGGLSAIAFLCFGIITWGSTWITGYQDIAIFCFVLVGSLLGFLYFNSHPAKVFMGDTGSMALGATLAAVAILTKHELSLAVIGGVFVIETLSSIIQIYSIKRRGKKVFLMAPIHHHFEKLGWEETDIVKLFYLVGFGLGMIAVYYGVWM